MRRLPRLVTRTCTLKRARFRRLPDDDDAGCNIADTMRTRTSFAGFRDGVDAGFLRAGVVAMVVFVAVVAEPEASGELPGGLVELSLSPASAARAAPSASPAKPAATMAATSFPSPRSSVGGLIPNGRRRGTPGPRLRDGRRTSASAQH